MSEGKPIYAAVLNCQQELKAPKDQSCGNKYNYRTLEKILERVKPIFQENGLILLLDDEIKTDAVGSYILATATLIDIATGDSIQTHATAREDVGTKFMSPGQATGACSSYARKYALCGMFAIDDSKDIDSEEYQNARQNAQNAAHGAQATNKNNNTDPAWAAAVKALNAKMKKIGISGSEVAAISGLKFGKVNTRDMSVEEVTSLCSNLEKWIEEEGKPVEDKD